VFVSAIVAESAGFWAVGKHPSGVVVALASLRPSVAVGVFVKAVGSVTAVAAIAAAIAATSAATACLTAAAATAAAGGYSIAVISGLEFISEEILDSLAVSAAESAGAGSLGAGLGADALALVVLIAGFLAAGVGRAVLGAAVHDVHDPLVGVSQVLLSTDGELEVLISGDDSHLSVVREGVRSVVHNGAIIVGHSKWTRVCHFVEIESLTRFHVLQLDDECIIAVDAALLVMQTDRVANLVKSS